MHAKETSTAMAYGNPSTVNTTMPSGQEICCGHEGELAGCISKNGYLLSSNSAEVMEERQSTSRTSSGKTRQELKLPSFKTLGIAAPRPDILLTPPQENSDWAPSQLHAAEYPPSAFFDDENSLVSLDDNRVIDFFSGGVTDTDHAATLPTSSTTQITMDQVEASSTMASAPANTYNDNQDVSAWMDKAIEAALSELSTGSSGRVVNMLSHSQPCPSTVDTELLTTLLPAIINALQVKYPSDLNNYIEVTHAVPPRFSIANLPNSPPCTPNPPTPGISGGGDYFTMTVFAKAVIAVDHHDTTKTVMSAFTPNSPHPVVAPCSVGISLLERFIPPSSAQEYLDLFSSEGPSVLIDRLIELSPNQGSLVFVYPTALGASTFALKYLGPLLDPLLRTMVGIHGLSADVGSAVGKLAAVEHMLPFEAMVRKISLLLRKVSRGTGNSNPGYVTPKYTLTHLSKEVVLLDRKAWMEWWLHQETPRIRAVMDRYYRRAVRLPSDPLISAGVLVRQIIDGVAARGYEGREPDDGIEVGVFVVKRSA